MAFSFEPFLAIPAGHIMAVSAGPEQDGTVWKKLSGEEKKRIEGLCDRKLTLYYGR